MKRIKSVLCVIVALMVLLCGCGAKTPLEKAEKQIKKWNKNKTFACTYNTDYEKDKFGYEGYDVYTVHMTDHCWDDYTVSAKLYNIKNYPATVYAELREIFGEDSPVSIWVRYYDQDGNLLYMTIDGEDFVD